MTHSIAVQLKSIDVTDDMPESQKIIQSRAGDFGKHSRANARKLDAHLS